MIPKHPTQIGIAHLTALHLPPVEFIRACSAAGYASVGLRVSSAGPGTIVYPLPAGSEALSEVRTVLRGEGMQLAEVEMVPLTPTLDPASVLPVLETGAELGATALGVMGDDPDRAALIDRFAAICDLADGFGMGVQIEFMRWRDVANLQDALEIVRGAGKANGHILLDTLHHFRAGGSVAELGKIAAGVISVVQLCDAPAALPDSLTIVDEARAARLPPGEGDLPIREALQALAGSPDLAVELPMAITRPGLSESQVLEQGMRSALDMIGSLA